MNNTLIPTLIILILAFSAANINNEKQITGNQILEKITQVFKPSKQLQTFPTPSKNQQITKTSKTLQVLSVQPGTFKDGGILPLSVGYGAINLRAYEKLGIPLSPSDYDSEATSEEYVALNSSDDMRWITSLAKGTEQFPFDSQIYIFNITDSIIENLTIFWEGQGDPKPAYFTFFALWNYSNESFYPLSYVDFTSEVDQVLELSLLDGAEDFVYAPTNTTEEKQVAFLVTTRKFYDGIFGVSQLQEAATSSGCDNNWKPNPPCTNTFDSNYNTFGLANNNLIANVYFNYTKPTNAVLGTKWQIKDGQELKINLTLPQTCFNHEPLQLYASSDAISKSSNWFCWNGAAWSNVRTYSLGTRPQRIFEEAIYWNVSTSKGVKTDFIQLEVGTPKSIAILFSQNLTSGISWNIENLPAVNQPANGNNGTGVTEYSASIDSSGTNVDVYIKANGDLITGTGPSIPLANEQFSIDLLDSTVPTNIKMPLTTTYSDNKIGNNIPDGTTIYLKFFLSAPGSQSPGEYSNNVEIVALPAGSPAP